ncbi:MAG: multi-sensor hybrid histidine kinase [Segetibacter sp.]|nr:multi-sensor hybrid histidine kinase [Segetibacter sp.]
MKNNIRTRLYVGFTVAIVLVLGVGIISLITFRKQHNDAAMIKQAYEVLNHLETCQKALIDMETGRRGFRSTNDQRFLEPYFNGLQSIRPILQELQLSVKDSQVQSSYFYQLQASIDDILSFWVSLGSNASGYTKERIAEIMVLEKQKMDSIRSIVDKMTALQNALLNNKIKQNRRSVTNSIVGLAVGIALILLIVIVLIYLILVEFRNRRKAENELQKSNKSQTSLNQETANKNWVLAGLAKVNDSLHNAYNSGELTQSLLNTIVRYLNVQAGAVYLYDPNDKRLSVSATYAIPSDFKRSFLLHEGLVGEAASKKEPTIITGLTREQIVFETATVNAAPAVACYMPLYIDDELKAVIELLSFEQFDEQRVELLKVTANNISVAINSVESNQKVIQLLSQVQEQKEILENQQEELRQTNEELSLQAEVLQASEEELRVQEEELRQINAELEEKNQAIESARAAVTMKAKELEATSKYKSEFLANMSHELRTPLNSVLILAKLLADNADNNLTEKQKAHARIIYKSGSDLLDLINDILDLSKIEAGKVEVNIEEVTVSNICRDLQQLFAVVADEKDIHFIAEVDGAVPKAIKTDKQKVEQVLKNLLSNAFKFTKKDGTVSLMISNYSPHEISFSVTDTGIGIPASKQKVIFEAFQQADMSTSRRFGGTGLGLSITKELVRLLKGKVELTSEEGKGSSFKIIIPIAALALTEEKVNVIEERRVEEIWLDEFDEQNIIADDRGAINKGDRVMLIIEDDIFFAKLVKAFAQERGYKAIVATNGKEGLMCAKKFLPSVITLDMNLPGIDGWTLLQAFKNDRDLKHIPVHIISAAEDEKINTIGALAYLQKPVEKEDLEKAFTLIGEYLHSSVKRVMVFSINAGVDGLKPLFDKKVFDIQFEQVVNLAEAISKLKSSKFDCLIADIGTSIEQGIKELQQLNEELKPGKIPTIIYLDKDISFDSELEIKKISSVVVRKSETSQNRLIEELELFLYKVQQERKQSKISYISHPGNDGSLEDKTVLVVDDDMRNVFALSAALEQEKMKVITASDGKDALEVLKQNTQVEIVLMDLMMPEMDGYEAMQRIRNELMLGKLPIIALTAKAMAGDREKCLEAGASDYITKPVNTAKLVSLMRVWLS